MGDLQLRIKAFVKLGDFFREFCEYVNKKKPVRENREWQFDQFVQKVEEAGFRNGWFTKENIIFSLGEWGEALRAQNLEKWLSTYSFSESKEKIVALIMAGNIPLVGFHDLLCALLTGNKALVKLSSNDNTLLPFICEQLAAIEPYFEARIEFTEGQLENFDAVIATGSNNTARYFEHYFGKYPHIIRKNRNSLAVLNGKESKEQLQLLGEDIFRYYGLGCRSVSKIFVPKDYNFDAFFEAMYPFKEIIEEHKYANNYDYNKAVYLMSEFDILDNGFLLLKEDENYGSPIATVFYEYYDSESQLKERLEADKELLQCVVSNGFQNKEVPFGKTQQPGLDDYADGIDTVEFLLKT